MNIAPGLEDLLHPVADLTELPGNPRRGDVEAVKRSYERFGQRKPIVVRRDGKQTVVVAGNHQLKAAQELGWESIAVVFADDLTDDEARGFALADNRVADLGGYDDSDLLALLEQVDDTDLLAVTGYAETDIIDLRRLSEFDPMGSIDDLLGEVGELDGTEGNVTVRLDVPAFVADQWKDHRRGFESDGDALESLLDRDDA